MAKNKALKTKSATQKNNKVNGKITLSPLNWLFIVLALILIYSAVNVQSAKSQLLLAGLALWVMVGPIWQVFKKKPQPVFVKVSQVSSTIVSTGLILFILFWAIVVLMFALSGWQF